MLPGMLYMWKPGMKKEAGMSRERVYFSTVALESKCSTAANFPLLTRVKGSC